MADVAKAKAERTKVDLKFKTAVGAARRANQQDPVNTRIVQQKLENLTAVYEDLSDAHADFISKAQLAQDDEQGEAWLETRMTEYIEVGEAGEVILDLARTAEAPAAPAADFTLQEKKGQLERLCQTLESALVMVTTRLDNPDELSQEEHSYLKSQTTDASDLLSREHPVLASDVRRLDPTNAETARTAHGAYYKEKCDLIKSLQLKLASKVPRVSRPVPNSSTSSSSDQLKNLHIKKAEPPKYSGASASYFGWKKRWQDIMGGMSDVVQRQHLHPQTS